MTKAVNSGDGFRSGKALRVHSPSALRPSLKTSSEYFVHVPFFSLSLFYRRKRITRTTSNDQWMRSWFGHRSNGARSAKSNRTCITLRSQSGWANAGRHCQRTNDRPTFRRRNDYASCTCRNTLTTSTDHGRRPNWAQALTEHRPVLSAIAAATATAAVAAVVSVAATAAAVAAVTTTVV